MKQITLFLICFFYSFQSFSQWTQTNGPEGGYFDEIVQLGSDFIVSAYTGGLYKSYDQGNSWIPSNSGLPDGLNIFILKKFEDILYTTTSKGIYKSMNGGESWTQMNSGNFGMYFYSLFVNGNNIFAGNDYGGITYSNDGGISWNRATGSVSNIQVHDFEIFNSKVYATGGGSSGTGPRFFESSDFGKTWQPIEVNGRGPNGFRTLLASDGNLYAGGQGELFVSYDNLNTWIKTPLETNASIVSIREFQGAIYVTAGNGSYYYSNDQGLSWSIIKNPDTSSFVNDILVSDSQIIMCTTNGLFNSFNSGVSWSSIVNGIRARRVNSLFSNDQYLYAGTDTHGLFRSADGGNTWISINSGLDLPNSLSINEMVEVSGILYIATNSGVYSWNNDENSWLIRHNPGLNRSADVLAFVNGTFVTADNSSIFLSNDNGENWTEKVIDILDRPTSFTSLVARDNTLILSTSDAEILVSLDFGDTWSKTSILDVFYYPYDLEFVGDKLFAATSQGVFVTDNLGQEWKRFNNLFSSSQDIEVVDGRIFVATDSGFLITREDLGRWYPANDGLGEQRINKIFINEDIIYAGTSGTSVWELPVSDAVAILPEVNRPFITTWKTDNPGSSEDNQITIPTFPGETYNYSVDWGDGSSSIGVTGDITHTYEIPGTYQVSIVGDFPRIYFNHIGEEPIERDYGKILTIDQWGDIKWKSMDGAFDGCVNLDLQASDVPDFSMVKSLQRMFDECSSLIGNSVIGEWDLSGIENLDAMFRNALLFNQNIGPWNVSNVMFFGRLFDGASAFNQDIGSWDVSKSEGFNATFYGASSFNQDLSGWTFPNAMDLGLMFAHATSFNQNIGNWNVSSVRNMNAVFSNATSFNQDISNWDVSSVVDMDGMFYYASSFNQDISGWDVSKVVYMPGVFQNASAFDQNLSNWNISEVKSMNNMFEGVTLSIANYDDILNGWSKLEVLQNGVVFDGGNSQYCLGKAARQKLIDDFGWTITDGGKAEDCEVERPFVTTWKTDNPGESEDNQITIPTFPGETYNYTVDWGDGTSNSEVTGDITHTYETPGTYQVSISGDFPRIYFDNDFPQPGDSEKILLVNRWGDISWKSMERAFKFCKNLDLVAIDTPDLSNATSLAFMFNNCESLTGNSAMNEWDVGTIQDMSKMFSGATVFNQNIGNWNTENVTNTFSMFSYATSFNQPIGNWNTSNLENMSNMFFRAVSFNQPIGNWDTSNVTVIRSMFNEAIAFNQDIGTWNTSKVTEMVGVFANNSGFNGDISTWDVSNVTDMTSMFYNAIAFDQPLDNWDVSNVVDMSSLFFGASAFNGDISNWNVTSAEEMDFMFTDAVSFNQDIGNWDVSNVENMFVMFSGASSFDQDLSNWNVANVTDMNNMFNGVSLSTENYDAILQEWSELSLQTGVDFNGGNSQYCLGKNARQKLIDDFGWTIIDAGKSEACPTEACPDILANEDDSLPLPTGTFGSGLDTVIGVSDITNGSDCALRLVNNDINEPWAKYAIKIDLAAQDIAAGDRLFFSIDGNSTNGTARIEVVQNGRPNTWQIGHTFGAGWSTHEQTMTVPDGIATLDIWIYPNFAGNVAGSAHYDNLIVRKVEGSDCPDILANEDDGIPLPSGNYGSGLDAANGVSDITNGSECAIQLMNNDTNEPWAKYAIKIDLAENDISAGDELYFSIDGNSTNGQARIEVVENGRPNTWKIGHSFGEGWSTHEQTITVREGLQSLDIWLYPNFKNTVPGSAHYDNLVVRKAIPTGCPDDLANEDLNLPLANGRYGSGLDVADGVSDVTNGSDCAIRLVNNDTNEPWAKYVISIDLSKENIAAGDQLYFSIDGNSTEGQARIEVVENNRPNTWEIGHSFGEGWSTHEQTITVNDGVRTLDIWIYPNFGQNEPGSAHYDNLVVGKVNENGLAGKGPLNALKIYPNPASERVSVSFEKPVTMGSMEIFDMSGRSVRKIAKAALESPIDVQDLKSGVYLLKAIDEKGNQFTKRIIVKH